MLARLVAEMVCMFMEVIPESTGTSTTPPPTPHRAPSAPVTPPAATATGVLRWPLVLLLLVAPPPLALPVVYGRRARMLRIPTLRRHARVAHAIIVTAGC